jgi:hypothetical protein
VVECDLANSPISNTFNNLTRLRGTAKSLEILGRRVSERETHAGAPRNAKSHSESPDLVSQQCFPKLSPSSCPLTQMPLKWCKILRV